METEAVHQTMVLPWRHRTEPAAVWVKWRVMVMGRSWSLERPSFRMVGTIHVHPAGG